MTESSLYQLSKHVRLSEADSGAVLLDTKRGRYWQLNITSARIVKLLIDGSTIADIVNTLTEETDAPRARIEADVTNTIQSLRKAGLIGRVRR